MDLYQELFLALKVLDSHVAKPGSSPGPSSMKIISGVHVCECPQSGEEWKRDCGVNTPLEG